MARDTDLADVVASESPHDWVLRHEANGASSQETLAFFDSLPCVALGDMMGCWRGSALPTGHPMDGLLQVFGWWGKSFTDADNVDPLLFQSRSGQVHAVTSRFLPVGILASRRATSPIITVLRPFWPAVRALLRTSKPMARLRMIEHRGRVSATMCYDYLPIHDVFRRVDETTVLGLMDMRGMPKPFFFLLRRHKANADSCLGDTSAYALPHGSIAEAITHSNTIE